MPLILLAVALMLWPSTRARRRLLRRRKPARLPQPAPILLVLAVGTSWYALGPAGAVAALLLGLIAIHRRRSQAALHRALAALDDQAEALTAFAAELATGAHPTVAAEHTAADAGPHAAAMLTSIATAARLGTDVGATHLDHAWRLTTRHGIPLTTTVTAVARDLAHRAHFTRDVMARLTGPRTSAAVLAGLPVLGLALGESMGAHPLSTLATTVAGQVLLVAGAVLTGAGLLWTARLTHRAIPL
ncbi:type II secretion system F family protein [Actinokineospora inagensis]|uniref:type II secretion system F family protein n=1 Tax=Actinokineospora inagensis TaxID=103730 RepID=UPI0004063A1A|nr:hypothetical protein [Actinokineospora inagensis]